MLFVLTVEVKLGDRLKRDHLSAKLFKKAEDIRSVFRKGEKVALDLEFFEVFEVCRFKQKDRAGIFVDKTKIVNDHALLKELPHRDVTLKQRAWMLEYSLSDASCTWQYNRH